MPNKKRPKKIAIITNEHVRWSSSDWIIKSIAWKPEAFPSFSDFDVLVFDMTTCPPQKEVNWPAFFKKMNFKTLVDVLGHDGQILVIGNPIIDCWQPDPGGFQLVQPRPFLWWTGLNFIWGRGQGDTTAMTHYGERRADYLSLITKYDYWLENIEVNELALHECYPSQILRTIAFSVRHYVWLKNRSARALASEINLKWDCLLGGSKYMDAMDSLRHTFNQTQFGALTLLPALTKDPSQSIRQAITSVLGIALGVTPPTWIDEYCPEGQASVDKSIVDIEAQIDVLERAKSRLEEDKRNVREVLRLLFDDGYSLEEIVRDAFRELSAEVEDPIEPNKEDGWIVVKLNDGSVLEGVLEVKSTERNDFDEKGIRQLAEWKNRGTLEPRFKKYKGIFVGSNAIKEPPTLRPEGFSDSFKKSAALNELCLLKGDTLYDVLMLHRAGKLDRELFWTQLFSTAGVFILNNSSAPTRS